MNKRMYSTICIIMAMLGYYIIKYIDLGMIGIVSIENIVGIVAILSGISGIVMSYGSNKQARLDAVKDYFQQGDTSEFVKSRREILYSENLKDVDKEHISRVCNLFHFWGLMNRKKYLPIWVFNGSSGIQVVKLYIKLNSIIEINRKENPFYAQEFELLSYRISKKYSRNFDIFINRISEFTDENEKSKEDAIFWSEEYPKYLKRGPKRIR